MTRLTHPRSLATADILYVVLNKKRE